MRARSTAGYRHPMASTEPMPPFAQVRAFRAQGRVVAVPG